jgi:hypothetical protein
VFATFRTLSKAIIDACSIIYIRKAGFFTELARTVRLYAPQEILDETGFDGLPVSVVPCQTDRSSNDHKLMACALSCGLPVISDDKEVLLSMARQGMPYFNALMMLHFLLFRKVIRPETHSRCFYELTRFAWYNDQILEFGKMVHYRIANPEGRISAGNKMR